MHPDVIVAPKEELARLFLADLARELDAARGEARFSLAVPGGSVAAAFFPGLARARVDWSKIEVFWTDERAVPPDSPESNSAAARELWLAPAAVPASHVHRMPADAADLRQAAREHADLVRSVAGMPPRIDYLLLGFGDDGHVASIFPGVALEEADEAVSWTDRAPKPPARRMTLTMATLARARRIVVAGFGSAKSALVANALAGSAPPSPLAELLRRAERVLVLLDSDPVAGQSPAGPFA